MDTKVCNDCGKELPITEFYKRSQKPTWVNVQCKECTKKRVYASRKTPAGLSIKIYADQKKRSIKRGHVAPDYTRIELLEWMVNQDNFNELFSNWKGSNYDTKLVPSVDRLDDYKPYTFDNMRLITWVENNRKVHRDMINGVNNKMSKAVLQYDMEGNFLNSYYSIKNAMRCTGVCDTGITNNCKGKYSQAGGFKWKYA